ncbi:MAG: hypothetical protein KGZ64_00290 [Thermaerobacter sp.]|nr:hypothetical protein [Thermaerobacter sp.]
MKACLVVVLSLVMMANIVMVPVARAGSVVGSAECLVASLMVNSTYLAIEASLSREGTILLDPRVAHRGDVDIIAFRTNNPDLSTVLVVLDAARQVHDVVAVQRGEMQSGHEASVSSASGGITAVSLLTGVAKEVIAVSPELEGAHASVFVVMAAVVIYKVAKWVIVKRLTGDSAWADLIISTTIGTAMAYVDIFGNICSNLIWRFHTERTLLRSDVVHVCQFTGVVTVP